MCCNKTPPTWTAVLRGECIIWMTRQPRPSYQITSVAYMGLNNNEISPVSCIVNWYTHAKTHFFIQLKREEIVNVSWLECREKSIMLTHPSLLRHDSWTGIICAKLIILSISVGYCILTWILLVSQSAINRFWQFYFLRKSNFQFLNSLEQDIAYPTRGHK